MKKTKVKTGREGNQALSRKNKKGKGEKERERTSRLTGGGRRNGCLGKEWRVAEEEKKR